MFTDNNWKLNSDLILFIGKQRDLTSIWIEEKEFIAKNLNSDRNHQYQLGFHDAEMHVTYLIFKTLPCISFLSTTLNEMPCFLNSLRHIRKTKVSFDG